MYCTKCGRPVRDGLSFCIHCGTKIVKKDEQDADAKGSISDKSSAGYLRKENGHNADSYKVGGDRSIKTRYLASALTFCVIFVIGCVMFSNINNKDTASSNSTGSNTQNNFVTNSTGNNAGVSSSAGNNAIDAFESKDTKEREGNAATTIEQQNKSAILKDFKVNKDTVEDYSQNLDPDKYIYYDAEVGDLWFSYPAYLFNDVSIDEEKGTTSYGENIKTITFSGSNGTQLIYSMYKRIGNDSIKSATTRINNAEHSKYYNVSDILVKSDDKNGRIVLGALVDERGSKTIYDMIRIDQRHVYRMAVISPKYRNDDEKNQFDYITENIYRLCGFSGSTNPPRTYKEFKEYYKL